jgi:hypothetical protein
MLSIIYSTKRTPGEPQAGAITEANAGRMNCNQAKRGRKRRQLWRLDATFLAGSRACCEPLGWRTACACCLTKWPGLYRQPWESLLVALLYWVLVLVVSTGFGFAARITRTPGSVAAARALCVDDFLLVVPAWFLLHVSDVVLYIASSAGFLLGNFRVYSANVAVCVFDLALDRYT